MEFLKKAKWAYVLLSLVLIGLGVCLIIWPDISSLTLCYIAGALTIIGGIVKLISYFANRDIAAFFSFDFALGLIMVIIGFILVMHPGDVVSLFPLIVGVYIIVDSVFKLQSAIDAQRIGLKYWWVSIILAAVAAIFGVLLVVNPFKGANVLMVIIGATLIFDGIENVWTVVYIIRKLKDTDIKEKTIYIEKK